MASKMEYAVVIGGTNIDIMGAPENKLIYHDSNVGHVEISLGGVGRNIAENLVRLSIETHLISVIGTDPYGDLIIKRAEEIGLNIENSMILEDKDTSIYLSILDEDGDMEIGLSSMENFKYMDIEFIKTKADLIENAKVCVIDTNIPQDTIEYILYNFKDVDFFLDTVSTKKAEKVKETIGLFHTIKPNRMEAEILADMKIDTDIDLERAIQYFHSKGVKNVFISLSKEGVIFSDGEKLGRLKAESPDIINATGAGDAFVAAICYGHMKGLKIEEKAKLAVGASLLALGHEETINPNMSIENVYKKLEELRIC